MGFQPEGVAKLCREGVSSHLGCGGCRTLVGTTECYEKSAVMKAACGFIAVPHDVYQRVCVGQALTQCVVPLPRSHGHAAGFKKTLQRERERVNPFIPPEGKGLVQVASMHLLMTKHSVDDSMLNVMEILKEMD